MQPSRFRPQRPFKTKPPTLEPYPPNVGKEEQALAKRLVGKWVSLPPTDRLRRIAAAVKGIWGTPPPDTQDLQAWSSFQEKHGQLEALLVLLRAADLPARVVQGLQLAESITNSTLTWIEIWTGQEWESLQPEKGEIYQKPAPLLPLTTNGLPAVRVIDGELSEVRWTLNREIINQWRMHFERIMRSNRLPRPLVAVSPTRRVSENLPHSHFGTDWCFDDLRPAQHGGLSNLRDLHACPDGPRLSEYWTSLWARDLCGRRPHRICCPSLDQQTPSSPGSSSIRHPHAGHHLLYGLCLDRKQSWT